MATKTAKWLCSLLFLLSAAAGCSIVSTDSAPVARLHSTPDSGSAPLLVHLDASASSDRDGTIASYAWSIDETHQLQGSIVDYTFTTSGIHSIELTVVDNEGLLSSQSVSIEIENTAPTVSCRLSTDMPAPGEWVTFDSSGSLDSDGSIVDVTWAFGDGSTLRGSKVGHAYANEGSYVVTLTVKDNCGASATLTHSIIVLTPSPSRGCGG